MDEITINKFNCKINMWDVFRIYESLTSEFLTEFNSRKKAIEAMVNDLFEVKVTCYYSGEIKSTYELRKTDIPDKNSEINIEEKKLIYKKKIYDFFSEKIDNGGEIFPVQPIEDLLIFCKDFFSSIREDIPESVSLKDNKYFSIALDTQPGFFSIYDYNLLNYVVRVENGKAMYTIQMTKNGVIVKSNDQEFRNSEEFIAIKDGPEIKYEKLPKVVRSYIERNRRENGFYSYFLPVRGEAKKQDQAPKSPLKQPLPSKNKLSEDEETKYKEHMFRQLQALDKNDNAYGNKRLIDPFPIQDFIFFSSITDHKKEIDPFFRENPGVLQYCNLSFLDFSKAEVTEFDFSNNPEVNILLNSVYNQDITGTNLKNNKNLSNQSLSGIIADRANLMGTNICVPLDKIKSCENAIFDEGCFFTIGISTVTPDQARSAGYIVEKKEVSSKDFLRGAVVELQNKAYKNELHSIYDKDEDSKIK